MQRRRLGGLEVPAVGLGLRGDDVAATDLLSRLHRRQHIGGVDVQLVEANVVEAEIRGRWLQRPERAIAEQLL